MFNYPYKIGKIYETKFSWILIKSLRLIKNKKDYEVECLHSSTYKSPVEFINYDIKLK